jgi:hypothetical protein
MIRVGVMMRVQISADTEAAAAQVDQLSRFYLTGLEDAAGTISVVVDDRRDALGKQLVRCRVIGHLGRDERLEVVEVQADLVLAITRALDRAVRALRRRGARGRLARSA